MATVDEILGPASVDDILGPPPVDENLTIAVDSILDAPQEGGGFVAGAGRVAEAAGDAIGHLFSGDFGMRREELGSLVAQTPEERTGLMALPKAFNEVLIRGGISALDVTMRALSAPLVGGAAAVAQIARESGMDSEKASKLELEILALAPVALAAVGQPGGRAPAFRAKARERIMDASQHLPPEAQLPGVQSMARALDEGMRVGEQDGGVLPVGVPVPALMEPRITQTLHKNVVDAAEELLTAGGVQRAEGRLLSDQIMELVQTRRLTTEQIGAVLQKHELTPEGFAEIWRVNIRKAAQDMQMLSAVEQRLKALTNKPGAEADLAALQNAAGLGADARGLNWWQRVDNVRRGLMVTQLATAVRNFETQTGRVGLDSIQQAMDAGLRRMFSSPEVQAAHPVDTFGALTNIFVKPRATKKQVDAVLDAFPVEQDRLFNNWMSEFSSGAFGKAETAVRVLNTVNRFQEYVIRRAVFQSRLDTALRAEGKSLEDIVSRNAMGEISRDAVKVAINDALEVTWGKGFSPYAKGAEGMAGSFIKLMNEVPGASMVIPFPRFMMNAIKFQYEWSPLGYLRLLSASERATVASGDFGAVSRATIGTSMLVMAYQLRDSEYAGEKWYEAKLPDGRTIDLRPFNPFASYLFVADIVKRKRDGTLDRLTAHDVATGILSTQMRAGTGAFILDSMFEGIAGLDVSEKGVRALRNLAGNWLSGFTVPFNTVSDFLAEFDDAQRIIRSGQEGPNVGPVNLGPVARSLPGVSQSMPAAQSPLREDPLRREAPLVRQLTGLSINAPKNPVEAELDRLGVERKEYFPSLGDPMADRLLAVHMGMAVERYLPQLVESAEYKDMPTPVQAFVLLESLKQVRGAAKEALAAQEPLLAARLKLEGMPGRKRKALDALSGGQITEAINALRHDPSVAVPAP